MYRQPMSFHTLAPDFDCDHHYHYERFPSNEHIRLVRLFPGHDLDEVACTLETYALEDVPTYEALSYTWGLDMPRNINCDGAVFTVRQNLFSALQALRFEDQERMLWIDAMSIDQHHIEEKNHQIRLMKQIYEKADPVIVWLGEADEDTGKAFDLLDRLMTLEKERKVVIPTPTDPMTAEELVLLGLPGTSDPAWRALDAIFWRDWFSRVWIIQEISVSRGARITCGSFSMDYDDFNEACHLISQRSLTAITHVDPLLPRSLGPFYYTLAVGIQDPLSRLLPQARDKFASNSSDKVYALLGLASDGTDSDLDPDYSLPASTVYKHVAQRTIELEQTLDILSHVEDHRHRLSSDLPSWVPDWEVRPPAAALVPTLEADFANATRGIPANNCTFSEDGSVLYVSGRVIDAADHIGDTFLEFTPLSGSFAGRSAKKVDKTSDAGQALLDFFMQQRWRQWEKIACNLTSTNDDNIPDAFIRTLIAGQELPDIDASPPSTDLQVYYQAWKRYWVRAGPLNGTRISSAYSSADPRDRTLATDFMRAHQKAGYGRRFFTTTGGRMGLCPPRTRAGDKVVLLRGGKTPYILKKVSSGRWTFVGEAYVEGLMLGEGWNGRTEEIGFEII
ncbi:MAG: hypothetical protein M1820_002791 [Bogoriella megaspora]|nr:MAG: hypothetical protein M1820_002791 [Bogoriella megaspora]